VLPHPVTKDGKTLNAPGSAVSVLLDSPVFGLVQGKIVFTGQSDLLKKAGTIWQSTTLLDYGAQERYAIPNAVLTVEGALSLAIGESEKALWRSRCLVTGYGRIGRLLCDRLRSFGADVTVAARSEEAQSWALCSDCKPVSFLSLFQSDTMEYDLIFHTVPAMIFPQAVIEKLPSDCVVLDLSSGLGPFASPEEAPCKLVKAPGLPGRFSPRTAGEIVADTIEAMLEEGSF
jgi:dipicolinate synthase subunit A